MPPAQNPSFVTIGCQKTVLLHNIQYYCSNMQPSAGRLNSLLKPSWPDAEKVQEEMYNLVNTLVIYGVDQKWFSAFALIEGAEEMVTTQEICAVS
jgi:hypothetical protein